MSNNSNGAKAPEFEGRKGGRLREGLRLMGYAIFGPDTWEDPSEHELRPDDAATFERINRDQDAIKRERGGLRLWRTLIVITCAVLPFLLLTVPDWRSGKVVAGHWVPAASLVFAECFFLILLLFVRARVRALNVQLQLLEYEVVLTSFAQDREKTAANLFFKHQVELKQYYDQTLRQNRQAFLLGLVCVAFGLGAIVAVAALLLANPDSATPAKITAGGLGVLSALLTGFVARIYLRVYEGSAKSLVSFHDRLVHTNHYHFANLIVAMIEPDEQRTRALSNLAGTIAAQRPETED